MSLFLVRNDVRKTEIEESYQLQQICEKASCLMYEEMFTIFSRQKIHMNGEIMVENLLTKFVLHGVRGLLMMHINKILEGNCVNSVGCNRFNKIEWKNA